MLAISADEALGTPSLKMETKRDAAVVAPLMPMIISIVVPPLRVRTGNRDGGS